MIHKSALVAATLVLAAAGAQARDVFWSVGINAPLQPGVSIGTVFSNAPAYHAAPVYYRPAPVIYAEPVYYPPPVYVQPRVVHAPRPVYLPQRVVYAPRWVRPGHGHRPWRHEQRFRGEPVMLGYGGR